MADKIHGSALTGEYMSVVWFSPRVQPGSVRGWNPVIGAMEYFVQAVDQTDRISQPNLNHSRLQRVSVVLSVVTVAAY